MEAVFAIGSAEILAGDLPPAKRREQRVFDVSPYLTKGIFTRLAQSAYFGQVRVVEGHVEWPEGQDFSRDTLYLRSARAVDPSERLHAVNEPSGSAARPRNG